VPLTSSYLRLSRADQDVLCAVPKLCEGPRRVVLFRAGRTPPTTRCTTTFHRQPTSACVTESGHRGHSHRTTPTPDTPTGNASLISPPIPTQACLGDRRDGRGATTDGTVFPDRHWAVSSTGSRLQGRQVSRCRALRPVAPAHVPVTGRSRTRRPRRALRAAAVGTDSWRATRRTPVSLAPGPGNMTRLCHPRHRGHLGERHPSSSSSRRLGPALSPPRVRASFSDFHDLAYAYTFGSSPTLSRQQAGPVLGRRPGPSLYRVPAAKAGS